MEAVEVEAVEVEAVEVEAVEVEAVEVEAVAVEVVEEEVHQLQPLKALYQLQMMLKLWEASLKSSQGTDSKPTTSLRKSKDTYA